MRHRPETLALAVVVASILAIGTVFAYGLVLTRSRNIETGARQLNHFGVMMAEHTARSLEAIDILLRELASDLSLHRADWPDWSPARGWEYVAQRHSRALPQLRDLIVFDRDGEQRFISTYFPPPRINVADRPYFQALQAGAPQTTYGPYIGRNSGRYTYALAHAIRNPNGDLTGAAFAAIEPAYLQDFCWTSRISDEFDAVLINRQGVIVASCRPVDTTRQSAIIGRRYDEALYPGQLAGELPGNGVTERHGLLVAVAPVPGYDDLRFLSIASEEALLTHWRERASEIGGLFALTTLLLFVGGLFIRRQVKVMRLLAADLEASREMLQTRVDDATAELARQRDDAERANQAKSRFLAAASHDLRQPLHALSLFAADLGKRTQFGPAADLQPLAGQIGKSTRVLGEMLDSLLDLSRLDVSGIAPDIRPFLVNPLFDRLDAAFRRPAEEKGLRLRLRRARYWANSDPVLVERLLANLIANAIRYTPPGGAVLVAARPRNHQLQIEVRDSGIGIAPEHQASIFDEFFQVGNTARQHQQGLGLGLSIVDRIARALGTPLILRSRPGRGSLFAIQLPVSRPRDVAPVSPAGDALHCVGGGPALLTCAELAATWGYAVSQAPFAGAAVPPADCIVLVDSAEAVAQTLVQPPGTPTIVLTGHPDDPVPPGCHALGMPVKPARLRALLNQLQKTLPKSMP